MNVKDLVLDAYDMMNAGLIDRASLEKAAMLLSEIVMGDEDMSRQLDRDFGIILMLNNGDKIRKFPLNSKANTIFSMNAYVTNRKKLPVEARNIIANRLKAACNRYDVELRSEVEQDLDETRKTVSGNYYALTDAVMGVFDAINDSEEIDESAGNSALETSAIGHKPDGSEGPIKTASKTLWGITETGSSQPYHKYPMKNSEQVKRLINEFPDMAPRMLAKNAFDLASNIVKRASELKIDIPTDSDVWSYHEPSLSPLFKFAVADRIKYLQDKAKPEEISDGTGDYMGLLQKSAEYSPKQVATILEGLDKSYHLQHRYGAEFHDPLTSTLTIYKKAENYDVAGTNVDITKLRKSLDDHESTWKEYFDEKLISELRSDTDTVFKSLPIPSRQLIANVLERLS